MLRLLALVALLALAPAAAAQSSGSLELVVKPPTVPIKPEVESPAFTAEVTAACQAVLARVSPSAPQEPVPVTLQFVAEAGVVITGEAAIPLDPQACVAGVSTTVSGTAVLHIAIPRTAPGLQALAIIAEARMADAGPTAPLELANVPFTVTADYYSMNQLKMAHKLQPCKPGGHASYDVEVVNLGNARTQYTFEVGSKPGGKWDIEVPATLAVDRGTSENVTFRVACTGMNSEGAFQVIVRPAAVDDAGKQGDPLSANLLARSRGVLPIPGPMAPLVAFALLGIATLARRRA